MVSDAYALQLGIVFVSTTSKQSRTRHCCRQHTYLRTVSLSDATRPSPVARERHEHREDALVILQESLLSHFLSGRLLPRLVTFRERGCGALQSAQSQHSSTASPSEQQSAWQRMLRRYVGRSPSLHLVSQWSLRAISVCSSSPVYPSQHGH